MSRVRLRETSRGPVLSGQALRVALRSDEGTIAIADAATRWAVVPRAWTAAALEGAPEVSSRRRGLEVASLEPVEDRHGRGAALRLRCRPSPGEPDLALDITLYEDQPFAVLRSHLENTTGEPLRLRAFHVLAAERLRLGPLPRTWRFYKQGWQSWSPTLVLPCEGEDLPMAPPVAGPGTQPPRRRGRFLSELVTTVTDPATGLALTAGFVSSGEQFSQLWLDRGPRALTAASYADGVELPPGAALASERLLVDLTPGPIAALRRYGDALGREMGALAWPHPVSGWCSWYCCWRGVSEEDVLASLEELARSRDALPLEYVQIDDGYQAEIGDWLTPSERFPHGLPWLAERIHRQGFRAGLWLAPFLMGARSRLYQEHPEWAVRHPSGRPYIAMRNWEQDCYALDCTREEALRWLEEVVRTVLDGWSFDYVKVDFAYAAAVDGLRHDPSLTRAQAYRRGMEAIRRAAGDRFVLGCGVPMGPSVGLLNGARIGPDVAPYWLPQPSGTDPDRSGLSRPSCLNAIRNALTRFWMHGRLWLNDPDCLLARDSETALTPAEVRTLATAVALSGGMTLDSDRLPWLSPGRRELISFLLPPYGRAAVPLDLFESEVPRLLQLDCASHLLLAVFNWADEEVEVEAPLPPEPVHAFEAWEGQYLGLLRGGLSLRLPPHGCRLLALRPHRGRPQVVGSTFHIAQGAVEVAAEAWDGKALTLSLRPVARRRGEVFLHAPTGTPAVESETPVRLERRPDGLLSLSITLDRPLEVRLRFGG